MVDPAPERGREARALRQLQSAMADAEAALSRRMRLHPTDVAAVGFLASAVEPVGPGELAQRLGLSPAAATEVVDRLTSVGHVERHRDLADRRRIRLEASGEAVSSVMGQLAPLIAAVDDVAAGLTESERSVVLRFLERVTEVYTDWADADRP